MALPDIKKNRASTKYGFGEIGLRIAWMIGMWVFRFSPRPCFGFRRWWLRLFGARVGKHVHLYPSSHVYYPWNLVIGDWSSIGEWALVYNLGKVSIGERVTISQRVHLCAGTHDYKDPAMPLIKSPITVGSAVWICADAFIGPGVSVADGAVVGACSVVVKDVPEWCVVAGNPAKLIKQRKMGQNDLSL
ncbi:putative colanic acid biosynthesis acetyltransferase WcaF [Prosthecobacter fusiformis]|uniref:Putative colanic acid biosynthesis acetyltransferase WcaF n=1 Tax=Prosthecobacter fusiformis TaxID=48464 RepID=A0A4R7RM29_9BACT|nr:putative colanic acid biosynthesis acetyltransferase [Prosthecobacter fusiformis]TDU64642.1 putative colanic acid biosynthesis acetyltransferase WcaF [Prosthecobacter fusiformis]